MGTDNKSQSQTQTQTRDPWYSQLGQDTAKTATGILNRPYTSYNGERVAPMSGNENAAYDAAGTMGAKLDPYENRLSQGFTPGALDQYMNPYVDKVLGARTRSINESYDTQKAGISANQAATDAFRTGRSDLARSRLGADRIRALDEATNSTKSDAFNEAMKSYFAQGNQDVNALNATTGAETGRIGALAATGATKRGISQAQNDFNYGQFLEKRDWDVNNMNSVLAAIQGINPAAGSTGTTTAKSSGGMLGEMLGLAATAAGGYMAMSPANGGKSPSNLG